MYIVAVRLGHLPISEQTRPLYVMCTSLVIVDDARIDEDVAGTDIAMQDVRLLQRHVVRCACREQSINIESCNRLRTFKTVIYRCNQLLPVSERTEGHADFLDDNAVMHV